MFDGSTGLLMGNEKKKRKKGNERNIDPGDSKTRPRAQTRVAGGRSWTARKSGGVAVWQLT
jgi:hypothetical protein